jgi:catechol 2,3-dioxygenase-like lactoylglutathione lyase family enzyme
MIKTEHIALASNNEKDSDKFFKNLLGLEKTRSFKVSPDLMEKFFGVKKEQHIIRYENSALSFEIFITRDDSKSEDIYSHVCLSMQDKESFVEKASNLGFSTIKVPRKNAEGYYYFVKDSFQNLYEIK